MRKLLAARSMVAVMILAAQAAAQDSWTIDSQNNFFTAPTGFNNNVNAIIPAPGAPGDVLVGGVFTSYAGTPCGHVVRLHHDGRIDASLLLGAEFTGAYSVTAMAPAADGTNDVYVVAAFPVGITLAGRIIRIHPDGSTDPSFVTGNGFNGYVSAIVPAADGDLYVAGNFSGYKGTPAGCIARLNSDGSFDADFAATDAGGGLNGWARSIVLSAAGDVYVGGSFNMFKGATPAGGIIRIHPDGSHDPAFASGWAFNGSVNSMIAAGDGSGDLVLGGFFSAYNGVPAGGIIRLNSDGSIDGAFATGAGFNERVAVVAPASDGTGDYYVGGMFTQFDGNPTVGIARLRSTGAMRSTFNAGQGIPNGGVAALVADGAGGIHVGGTFTVFDPTSPPYDTPWNYIVRIQADGRADTTFDIGFDTTAQGFPTPICAPGGAVVSGVIYVCGGTFQDAGFGASDRTWALDPSKPAEGWKPKARLPVGVQGASCAAVGGKIYCIGGMTTSDGVIPLVQVYDPAADAWSSGSYAPCPLALANSVCGAIGDRIYVCGGTDGGSFYSDVLEYDPAANSWTQKAKIEWNGVPLVHAASCGGVIDGRLYLLAGMTDGAVTIAPAGFGSVAMWEFNPAGDGGNGTWTQKSDLPMDVNGDGFFSYSLYGCSSAAIGNSLFIMGGDTSMSAGAGNGYTGALEYRPIVDKWYPRTGSPEWTWGALGLAAAGKAYLVGNSNTGYGASAQSVQVYTPPAGGIDLALPTDLKQVDAMGNDVDPNAVCPTQSIHLKGTLTAPAGRAAKGMRLEVEVILSRGAYTGVPSTDPAAWAPAGPAEVVYEIPEPGDYAWRARVVDEDGNVSAWIRFGVTLYDFAVRLDHPLAMGQVDPATGEDVPEGGAVTGGTILLQAQVTGWRAETTWLEVEVYQDNVGTKALSSVHGAPGLHSVTFTLPDWTAGFRWSARLATAAGRHSEWTDFGKQDGTLFDFVYISAPADLMQRGSNGANLASGDTSSGNIVTFSADVTIGVLEIEVVPANEAFSGTPLPGTNLVDPTVHTVTCALNWNQSYQWRARMSWAGTHSTWTDFDVAEGVDFRVPAATALEDSSTDDPVATPAPDSRSLVPTGKEPKPQIPVHCGASSAGRENMGLLLAMAGICFLCSRQRPKTARAAAALLVAVIAAPARSQDAEFPRTLKISPVIADFGTTDIDSTRLTLTWEVPYAVIEDVNPDPNAGIGSTITFSAPVDHYELRVTTDAGGITEEIWASLPLLEDQPLPIDAVVLPDGTLNTQEFEVSGLVKNTEYWFGIRAYSGVLSTGISSILVRTGDDILAPAAVVDLSVVHTSEDALELAWTAVGDNGWAGRATTYDLRYSTAGPISSDEAFTSATPAPGLPAPRSAGLPEGFTVNGLAPHISYWFAIRTVDEVENWSELSGSPQGATFPADETRRPICAQSATSSSGALLLMMGVGVLIASARRPR